MASAAIQPARLLRREPVRSASPAGAVAAPAKLRAATGGTGPATGIAYDRLMLVLLLFVGAIFLIAARLAHLQLTVDDQDGGVRAAAAAQRGDIVDRNGVVLATTIDTTSIGVQPDKVIGDKVELAARLNELMPEQSADWYLQMLSGTRFKFLKRHAEPSLVQAVNALGEPGITFPRETERLYPQGGLAGHVLGWMNREGLGAAGVERGLQDQIGGGGPVALSIDSRVQAALENELDKQITALSAAGGSGIVMDVDTGEVLAMASGPTFNPNVPGDSPVEARTNSSTYGVYELGSTFKPLTMAAAIDAGVTRPAQRWDSSPVTVGRFTIHDHEVVGRPLTVPEILTHSSNTATARVATAMGPERMNNLFRSLHFNERMPIELNERAMPIYPNEWGPSRVMTTGFGHSIAVTPLHLAAAYAALVNGGVWRPATLVKQTGQAPAGERVFSADTSYALRQMLRLIVTDGTGRSANADGYRIGGKTGTAEKAGRGGYSHSVNVSTFVAAFPMDRPRYVVLVMLDSPHATAETRGQTTAAWTAAPVVRAVIERTGMLLGITPETGHDIDLNGMRQLVQGAAGD